MEQNDCITKIKKWEHINEKKRYQIEALLKAGKGTKEISQILGYSQRTIQREIKRGRIELRRTNPNYKKNEPMYINVLEYCADVAQQNHESKGSGKGPTVKIGHDTELVKFIEDKILKDHWSPEVIIKHIQNNSELQFKTSICTKTLYNYIDQEIFLHISNKDLWCKCDNKKREYKRVHKVALNNRCGKSIEDRPENINERQEKGHWELDLVVGKMSTKPVIMTLVERVSRKSIYILTKDKTQTEVLEAIKKAKARFSGNFTDVIKTITTDNGSEFLNGKGIKEASGCEDVFYAHPYCSWEKGTNENGNRMLRRFFPKGTDFSEVTEEELQRVEDWVNNYPRRILGFKTANEVFYAV